MIELDYPSWFHQSEEFELNKLSMMCAAGPTRGLLAAAAVLAMSVSGAALAGPAASNLGTGTMAQGFVDPSQLTVLYAQNGDDAGVGIVSQNFETGNDIYDSQIADDFGVPRGVNGWKIKEVDVAGVYFNGFGPAVSQHVTFYKSKNGKPGAVIMDYPGLVGMDNGTGSFRITLPTPLKLPPGHYFMSVQIDMDFTVAGEWAWENQTTVVGSPAVWKNPADGFGTTCTVYTVETVCIPNGQGDHIFALKGAVL